MGQAQASPWAGVPYNPDVTMADIGQQAPVWASAPMTSPAPTIQPPIMPNVKPVMDPHAGLPPVFAPTPKPNPQDEITGNLQGRYEKDIQKDADPYGSPNNHPGFFGKLAHGLNVAFGGVNRRTEEEGQIAKQLNDVVGDESTNNYRNSETAKNTEDTAEAPQKASDAHALSGATESNLESETDARNDAAANPTLAIGYAHAVNQAIKEGRDPSTDPIVQHLQDAITGLQKQTTPPPGTKTVQLEVGGKPHQVLVDERTGETVKDLGVSGEKPPSVNVNAGEASLDRESKQFGSPHGKAVTDADSQLEKIADARSMINGNAESQALGIPKVLTALVSGAGSGVRITMPELQSIATARGLGGDVQGTLNSWAGKGKLTSTQQQQLTGILDSVKQRIMDKQAIHSQALDAINSGANRNTIVNADKEARQKITDLETKGHYVGQTVQTKQGPIVVQHVYPNGRFD
jgi:hypothetical protein